MLAHLLRDGLQQGFAQQRLRCLRPLCGDQKIAQGHLASRMAGKGGEPLAENRFGLRQFAELLQGRAGFEIGLGIVRLEREGVLEASTAS